MCQKVKHKMISKVSNYGELPQDIFSAHGNGTISRYDGQYHSMPRGIYKHDFMSCSYSNMTNFLPSKCEFQ